MMRPRSKSISHSPPPRRKDSRARLESPPRKDRRDRRTGDHDVDRSKIKKRSRSDSPPPSPDVRQRSFSPDEETGKKKVKKETSLPGVSGSEVSKLTGIDISTA